MNDSADGLSALRAFVTAADTRSFTVAGQQLGMSASGIGKAVQKLEQQLGAQFFHRTPRAITLTEAGERFAQRCRRMIEEMDAARNELAETAGQPRGRLKISLPIANGLFTPALGAFADTYPDIRLDVDYNDRFVDVIEEGFDVAIRSGDPSDSRLRYRRLGGFRRRLVAAPAYLARAGVPSTIGELARHRCLRHRYPQTGKLAPWPFSDDQEITIPVSLATTLIDAVVLLAEQGRGIALLPNVLVREQLADGRLTELLAGSIDDGATFGMLWPASRFPSPTVRAFVDFTAEHFGSLLD